MTILLFTGGLPMSCCFLGGPGSCGCGDIGPSEFNITQFDMYTIDAINEKTDTSLVYIYDEVFKYIEITGTEFISVLNPKPAFYNAAYACSPASPVALQNFESITIFSLNSFALVDPTDIIHVGDNLTERFLIAPLYSGEVSPIDEYIANEFPIYDSDSYKIVLAHQPYQETTLKLKFVIEMTDGNEYIFENELLKVK